MSIPGGKRTESTCKFVANATVGVPEMGVIIFGSAPFESRNLTISTSPFEAAYINADFWLSRTFTFAPRAIKRFASSGCLNRSAVAIVGPFVKSAPFDIKRSIISVNPVSRYLASIARIDGLVPKTSVV